MLVLKGDPHDGSSLATAFRLLHSIKGAAGMMGFDQITVLTHHLETRVERLRGGRIELDRVTMKLTLRCVDFLRECNDRLRDNGELATPDVLLQELRDLEEKTENELNAESIRNSVVEDAMKAKNEDQVELKSPVELESVAKSNATNEIASAAIGNIDLGTHYHVAVSIDANVTLKEIVARSVVTTLDDMGDIEATRPDVNELDQTEDLDTFDVIVLTERTPDQILWGVAGIQGVTEVEVRIPRDDNAPPLATTRAEGAQEETSTPSASPSDLPVARDKELPLASESQPPTESQPPRLRATR